MPIIISSDVAGTTLPTSPQNGQVFIQTGVGVKIFTSSAWQTVDQNAAIVISSLIQQKEISNLVMQLSQVANASNVMANSSNVLANTSKGIANSSNSLVFFTEAIANSSNSIANSSNLAANSSCALANSVNAIAVIDEYWMQLKQSRINVSTNGEFSLANNESFLTNRDIISAHSNSVNVITATITS